MMHCFMEYMVWYELKFAFVCGLQKLNNKTNVKTEHAEEQTIDRSLSLLFHIWYSAFAGEWYV